MNLNLNSPCPDFNSRRKLFRPGVFPLSYSGQGYGLGPGPPNRGAYQRRQAGGRHIQKNIPRAGTPGRVKTLAPFVHRGNAQTQPQRPEASAPRFVACMSPKSPEPEKVHKAVSHDMAAFPHIMIDHFKLGRIKGHNPGQKPVKQCQGVFSRTPISRHDQNCHAPQDRGGPIIEKVGFSPNRGGQVHRFGSLILVQVAGAQPLS
jgi:hypothetical protein